MLRLDLELKVLGCSRTRPGASELFGASAGMLILHVTARG